MTFQCFFIVVVYALITACMTLGSPNSWRIEHLFVDDPALDMEESGSSDGSLNSANSSPIDPTPMLFKCVGHCDREGLVTGSRVVIDGCKWASINKREFIVEATSGWYFVYEEVDGKQSNVADVKKLSQPICGITTNVVAVRPTNEEYQTLFDNNERGYLTKRSAGTIRIV